MTIIHKAMPQGNYHPGNTTRCIFSRVGDEKETSQLLSLGSNTSCDYQY